MRSLVIACAVMFSFNSFAAANNNETLFSELKSTSWTGSFHFEVFNKTLSGKKRLAKTSEEYSIDVDFAEAMTEEGQIPYLFSKDVESAEKFDKFVFNNIDVQSCPGETRQVEVLGQNDDGSYNGTVHAPECKDGKRTVKQLHIQSIKRDGDHLSIIIAEKAIGEFVTFKIIYKFTRLAKEEAEENIKASKESKL